MGKGKFKGGFVPPGKGFGKFSKGKWPPVDPARAAAAEQAKRERKDALTVKLVRAIMQGIKRAGGKLPLAQCGSIAEVANLRKDPEWEKDMKLISLGGFIKSQETRFKMELSEKTDKHPSASYVFLLNPDEELPADLMPSAGAAAGESTEPQEPKTETATVSSGMTMMEKWQVLRQNIIATLEHNGCQLDVTRVASDVSVRDAKKAMPGSFKLVEFLTKFPQNFELQDQPEPDKPMMVVLLCTNFNTAPIPGGWESALGGRAPVRGSSRVIPPPATSRTHFHKPNSSGVVPLTGPQSTFTQSANQAQLDAIRAQAAQHASQIFTQQVAQSQYTLYQQDYAAQAAAYQQAQAAQVAQAAQAQQYAQAQIDYAAQAQAYAAAQAAQQAQAAQVPPAPLPLTQ